MNKPIAGAGFALMAWRLSKERHPLVYSSKGSPLDRAHVTSANPISAEFYRITDNAWVDWHHPAARRGETVRL